MSRITDYILEPKVVYTEGGFLVRVKVQDDYKYKKYIVSENLHYKTVQGTSFTLTDASSTKQASITELKGNTTQEGTPTPSNPIEVKTVSGDNNIVVSNKNLLELQGNLRDTSSNGILATFNSDTSITISGQATSNYAYLSNAINCTLPIGTYTLSIDKKLSHRTYINVKFSDNTTSNYIIEANTLSKMFTTEKVTQTITLIISDIVSGTTYNETIYFQLEKGNQATTYTEHQGNSYRVDLGGKNKLINNSLTQTYGGVTYTVNDDKSITLNGTSTTHFVVELNNNMVVEQGQYTLSLKGKIQGCGVYAYVGSGTLKAYVSSYNTAENWQSAFTLNEQTTFTQVRIDIQNGKTFNNITIYPQLEKGTVATPYSPYTDNPIELCKIGNYVDKLKRAEGKQLFDKDDVENDKRLDSSGQPITNSASGFSLTNYIKVEPNTKYTYSRNTTSSSYYVNICEYTSDKTHIQRLYKAGDTTTTFTFTTPSNCYYLRINDATTNLYSIMLNEGSTALPYEPYGTNWYIEKNIGKVVLNGTENWKASSTTGVFLTNTAFPSDVALRTQPPFAYSSHFNYHYYSSSIQTSIKQGEFSWSGAKLLVLRDTSLASLTDLTTWLSNNNVTLYYVLANPTYAEITDTYLLEQLNGLLDIELYEDLCYVDWVGSEAPTMSLLYAGTEDLGIKYIITEDGKKIRTDWRKLGRRKNGRR